MSKVERENGKILIIFEKMFSVWVEIEDDT